MAGARWISESAYQDANCGRLQELSQLSDIRSGAALVPPIWLGGDNND
jgi:hypothetical protein